MTAEVELLPLPSPQVPFIDCDPSMTDIRRLVRWYEQGATEYARANVARAIAAKDAEIERLRAEVEAWRELSDHVRVGACAAIWPDRYTDARTRDVAAALKRAAWMAEAVETLRAEVEKVTCELMDAITRADKLTEALREWWSAHRPVGWTEDQHRARPYVNLITVADKALTEALLRDQEARND